MQTRKVLFRATLLMLISFTCIQATQAQSPAPTSRAPNAPSAQSAAARGFEAALKDVAEKIVERLEAAGQKSITVVDFTDLQGQGTELGRFLAQELSDQVVSVAKSLSLVDRANLQHLLRENKLSMEGLVNPESSRQLGNLIGIDTIILGTVTPIGDTVRLSVRAVTVETGRVAASQSTTVPALGSLAELYTRGVAATPASDPPVNPTPASVTGRLRADSLKIVGNGISVLPKPRDHDPPSWTTISFSILNQSGANLKVGYKSASFVAGPCAIESEGRRNSNSLVGLPVIDRMIGEPGDHWANRINSMLALLPTGARLTASARILALQCNASLFSGVKVVPITLTLVVADGKDVIEIPLSADNVSVRTVGQ